MENTRFDETFTTFTSLAQNFGAPSFDDKKLEVVAVFGSMQMAVSRVINLQHHRIAQVQTASFHTNIILILHFQRGHLLLFISTTDVELFADCNIYRIFMFVIIYTNHYVSICATIVVIAKVQATKVLSSDTRHAPLVGETISET